MKLRKTSVGLVAIAALLGGVVYVTTQGEPPRELGAVQADRLFGFQEAEVQVLTIKTLTKSLAFERAPGSSPAWKMTAPKLGPANAGAIAFLLNLCATGKSQASLKVPVARLPEFELDHPFATIEVKLKDQKTYRMTLGKANFNNTGIYAQINPPQPRTAEVTVVLVPLDFQNAVTRSDTEWQTALPEASPKLSPSPAAN